MFRSNKTILLLPFLLFILGCDDNTKSKQIVNRAVPVLAFKAQEVEFNEYVEAFGTAKSKESVNITASVTEVISSIDFYDGDYINKGDTIAHLSSQEQEAAREAEYIQLKEHERELARLEKLLKSNSISKNDYESRKTRRDISAQKIKKIEATIADRVIISPFSGYLGLRNISVGSLVKPGDIITTLDDVSNLKLDLDLPDKYLNTIKPGMLLSLSTKSVGELSNKAMVSNVDSRIDTDTRTIKVRAIIENNQREIKPGLFVRAKIYHTSRKGVFIPEESVFNSGETHYVWKIESNNKVFRNKVTLGARFGGYVEINAGISEGDDIVARGILFLQDGTEVNVTSFLEGASSVFK